MKFYYVFGRWILLNLIFLLLGAGFLIYPELEKFREQKEEIKDLYLATATLDFDLYELAKEMRKKKDFLQKLEENYFYQLKL
ncbi:MAG: hypothetical protein DRI36_06735, partial [Caldiserica bacterium]